MQTLQLLCTLAIWYLPGVAAARIMARRGHDALAWTYAVWIGGALVPIAAVVWVLVAENSGDTQTEFPFDRSPHDRSPHDRSPHDKSLPPLPTPERMIR